MKPEMTRDFVTRLRGKRSKLMHIKRCEIAALHDSPP